MSFDQQDELCIMSSSFESEFLEDFADEVITAIGQEYLRHSNENDLLWILAINASSGFP